MRNTLERDGKIDQARDTVKQAVAAVTNDDERLKTGGPRRTTLTARGASILARHLRGNGLQDQVDSLRMAISDLKIQLSDLAAALEGR